MFFVFFSELNLIVIIRYEQIVFCIIKRSIEDATKCQISKRGYQRGPSDEALKKARCQFCEVKFGHRIMEAVGFFDHKMHDFFFTNYLSFHK